MLSLRIVLLSIYLFLLSLAAHAQTLMPLSWQLGYHKSIKEVPSKWIKASVPGAIQLDVMVAEKYKQPYWYANNYEQFTWMEPYYFTYKTNFKKPELKEGQKLIFHSKGIDYQFDIALNGKVLHKQEGMFTYVNLDLSAELKDQNELTITLYPVPTVAGARNTIWHYRDNAAESVKPAVSYGWDWHPRLITRGIWDETGLIVQETSALVDAEVSYTLHPDLRSAQVQLMPAFEGKVSGKLAWTIKSPGGATVLRKVMDLGSSPSVLTDSIKNIELWWPNGYGKPSLYTSEVVYTPANGTAQTLTTKIGFRQIKLIMSEGGWLEPSSFPKSRSVAPANFEVNGKRIFAKGSNWVHPEIFMGLATRSTYEAHIKLAKEANFNIFRVWGGGVINKESFFDLCDSYGILVWQEFPLACNLYPDSPRYLKVLEAEATSIVKRGRRHASLALWCGGNELFNEWSRMTEQSLPLRLLNTICYNLDPKTPFIYTSPLYGMAHGHYVFWELANGGEVFQWMPNAKNTAYTEYGVPSVANLEVLKSFIPKDELFPPRRNTAWESHHAFNVWGANRWLELPFLEEYFGKIGTLEDLVFYSQLSQCEGYKCIFEESRRQKPYCGMAINWCYQEPWPCAANNSLINWPSVPKPALYHVGKSCRPILASARFPKFRWDEGETFSCDLFMLNDSFESIKPAKVSVKLVYDDSKELKFLQWDMPGGLENTNIQGPTARVVLPPMQSSLFKVVVEVEGMPSYTSEYTFVYRGSQVKNAKPKIKYLNGVTE